MFLKNMSSFKGIFSVVNNYFLNHKLIVFFLIFASVIVNSAFINSPFIRTFDSMSTARAIRAYNHIKYGFAKTRGGNIDVLKHHLEFPIPLSDYYLSAIPIKSYTYIPGLRIFGKRELPIRLTNIFVYIFNSIFFYFLLSKIIDNNKLQLLIFFVWAFLPANLFFRQLSTAENFHFVFSFLTIYFYYKNFVISEEHNIFFIVLFSSLGFIFCPFDSFILLGIIFYEFIQSFNFKNIIKLLPAVISQIIIFLLYILFNHFVIGASIFNFFTSGSPSRRSFLNYDLTYFFENIYNVLNWIYISINHIGVIFIIIGFITLFYNKKLFNKLKLLIFIFTFYPIINIIIFPGEFFAHSYKIIVLTYILSIIIGTGLYRLSFNKVILTILLFVFMFFFLKSWYNNYFNVYTYRANHRFARAVNIRTNPTDFILTNREVIKFYDSWYLERNFYSEVTDLIILENRLNSISDKYDNIYFVLDNYAEQNEELTDYLIINGEKIMEWSIFTKYRIDK